MFYRNMKSNLYCDKISLFIYRKKHINKVLRYSVYITQGKRTFFIAEIFLFYIAISYNFDMSYGNRDGLKLVGGCYG